MIFNKVSLSLLTTATILTGGCYAQTSLQEALNAELKPQSTEVAEQTTEQPEQASEPETPTESRWIGKNFSQNESLALKFFQDYGITDRMALAVILGNIKQESNFHPNICEGGARVNYENCHRGGYGLVQWTTSFRYWGLGNHAQSTSGNPSEIETQLSYLVTEREWKEALWRFKTPEKSLDFYMKGAYRWLGWGIYGNRGYYSQKYYDSLTLG